MTENENTIRLLAFVGALLLFLVWERLSPRIPRAPDYTLRCLNNLALILVSSFVIRLCFPVLVLSTIAFKVNEADWGLFSLLSLHESIQIILSIIILDLVIYWQHVATHHIPLLWRLHRLHHSDPELNTTTAIRFHPLEIVFSILIKALAVIILGIPMSAVILFELILNVAPMFNHANIKIPTKVDRYLRYIIVTPDMHRIHHSSAINETNSNYGFFIPWWDRLFGSYTDQPQRGYQDMHIGLDHFRVSETLWLHRLLAQPFINPLNNEEKS